MRNNILICVLLLTPFFAHAEAQKVGDINLPPSASSSGDNTNKTTPAQELDKTIRDNIGDQNLITKLFSDDPNKVIINKDGGISLPSIKPIDIKPKDESPISFKDIPDKPKAVLIGVSSSGAVPVAWIRVAGYDKTIFIGDDIMGLKVKKITESGIELVAKKRKAKYYEIGNVLPFDSLEGSR